MRTCLRTRTTQGRVVVLGVQTGQRLSARVPVTFCGSCEYRTGPKGAGISFLPGWDGCGVRPAGRPAGLKPLPETPEESSLPLWLSAAHESLACSDPGAEQKVKAGHRDRPDAAPAAFAVCVCHAAACLLACPVARSLARSVCSLSLPNTLSRAPLLASLLPPSPYRAAHGNCSLVGRCYFCREGFSQGKFAGGTGQ